MLFTKSTVGEKVFQKIKKKSLDYIIIETYMGALPFDEEFTDKRKHEGAHFEYNVLESINVSDMLDKAIESETDVRKRRFLNEINSICVEAAKAVAYRVAKDLDETDASGEDIIKSADLNTEEKASLVDSCKKLDQEGISDFIENKVINEVTEEAKRSKEEDEINQRIKDKLSEVTDDGEIEEADDKAVDAFIRYNTSRNDLKGHTSLFSTIQTSVLESLLTSKENYHTFNIPVITPITMEFFGVKEELDSLSKIEKAVENTINLCNPEFSSISPEKIQKITLINTITIYTLLQTLYTLGILRPQINDVKDYIMSRRSIADTREEQIGDLKNAINYQIQSIGGELVKCKTKSDVECVLEKLNRLKSAVNDSNCNIDKLGVCEQIDSIIESCNEKISIIEESMVSKPINLDDRHRIYDIVTL